MKFFDQKHKYNWDIKFNASERQKRSIQEQAALLQSHAKQMFSFHWKTWANSKYHASIELRASERQKIQTLKQLALQSHARQICGASVVHWKF